MKRFLSVLMISALILTFASVTVFADDETSEAPVTVMGEAIYGADADDEADGALLAGAENTEEDVLEAAAAEATPATEEETTPAADEETTPATNADTTPAKLDETEADTTEATETKKDNSEFWNKFSNIAGIVVAILIPVAVIVFLIIFIPKKGVKKNAKKK